MLPNEFLRTTSRLKQSKIDATPVRASGLYAKISHSTPTQAYEVHIPVFGRQCLTIEITYTIMNYG